jgi:hypothetical protein
MPEGEAEKRPHRDGSVASVGMLATGGGAIPKEGSRAEGSSEATEPSSQRKRHATGVLLKPERTHAEQSERTGGGGAITARSARWFRRISGHAGVSKAESADSRRPSDDSRKTSDDYLTIPGESLLEKQDVAGLPVNPAFPNAGKTARPKDGRFRPC